MIRRGDVIALRFPYDERLRDRVRSLRVRRWVPDLREWQIPFSVESVQEVYRIIGRAEVTLEGTLESDLHLLYVAWKEAKTLKQTGDADLGSFPWVTEPWPHQRAAVKAAGGLDGYGLFWEMGTGKTKAGIDISRYKDAKTVLVLVRNEVVRNWPREIALHANEKALALDSEYTLRQRAAILGGGRLPRWVILNIEALDPLIDSIERIRWDMCIIDESTRFKNVKAKRTLALRRVRAASRLAMTGTPVTQHLYDLYPVIDFLKPGLLGDFHHFRARYFELMWSDTKHRWVEMPRADTVSELLHLIDGISYRLTKEEALPWLPAKLPPKIFEVRLEGPQRDAYVSMKRRWEAEFAESKNKADLALTQKLRLREITSGFVRYETTGHVSWFPSHAKGRVVRDLVEDLMPGKVVIFCEWRPECEFYRDQLAEHGAAILYGGIDPRDRDSIVQAFQGETTPRVLVCQISSGGIGINLTAAHTAIYASRNWSLEDWKQSQDRLHRAGQRSAVSLVVVQARGTVDEEIEEVLSGKAELAEIVNRDRVRLTKRIA
jgi:superfamily II DNA or RNA helicase